MLRRGSEPVRRGTVEGAVTVSLCCRMAVRVDVAALDGGV